MTGRITLAADTPCPLCGRSLVTGNGPVHCVEGHVWAEIREGLEAATLEAATLDGAELLDAIAGYVQQYVVLPSDEVADLLALWVLHTHCFEAAFSTPYLRITSATAECGKSLLLEVLEALCCRSWLAISPSVAVLFRKIDKRRPTLLLDELDNFPIEDRRETLSILNTGYKRGATVDRCAASGDELVEFSVFCPKAYAGIDVKALPDTLLSRSITIRLERRLPEQKVDMWLGARTADLAQPLNDACSNWAASNVETLGGHEPTLPEGIRDRAAEVWWPLLSLAELAGGGWPKRARDAATKLSRGGDAADEADALLQLLSDVRACFKGAETIFTTTLLDRLNAIEESPWGARRRSEGLDARGLARMLRPLRIRPRTVRVPGVKDTSRGYHLDQFREAFARYPSEATQATQATQAGPDAERDVSDVLDVLANPGCATDAPPARCTCQPTPSRLPDETTCRYCGGSVEDAEGGA